MRTTPFCLMLVLLAFLPLAACKKEETKADAYPAAAVQITASQPVEPQMMATMPEETPAAAVAAPGDAASEEAPVRDSTYITVDQSQDCLVDRNMVAQIQSSRTPEELKAANILARHCI